MLSGMYDVSSSPAAAARTCRCAGKWRYVGTLVFCESFSLSSLLLRISPHSVDLCWSVVLKGCQVADDGCTAACKSYEGVRCTIRRSVAALLIEGCPVAVCLGYLFRQSLFLCPFWCLSSRLIL